MEEAGMSIRADRIGNACRAAAAVALLLVAVPATAQSLNDLTGALGGQGAGLPGLPSVNQASTGNLAGVLQYCVKNKYLGGDDTGSVEQSLMGKLGGADKATKDKGFKAGSGGLLETGGGGTFGLGGDGMQRKVTDQVCDLVLKHAQS